MAETLEGLRSAVEGAFPGVASLALDALPPLLEDTAHAMLPLFGQSTFFR